MVTTDPPRPRSTHANLPTNAMNHKELVLRKIEWLQDKIRGMEDELQMLNNQYPVKANSIERSIQKLDYALNILIEIKLAANREE